MLKTVLRDFRSKTVIAFVVCSLVALFSHRLGLMDVSIDLLDKEYLKSTIDFHEGDVVSALFESDGRIIATCELQYNKRYSLCGIQMLLTSPDDQSSGIDLSTYQTVEMAVELKSPANKTNVKLHFRNYDPVYSSLDDDTGNKFNTIEFFPESETGIITIPIKAFFVAQWWKRQHQISYEHSHVDFSNIVMVEIASDDMTELGNYILTISSLKMRGEFISESELLKLILLMLFVTIVSLTIRQKNSLRKISTTDPLTGLLNRRGMTLKIDKEFKQIMSKHSVSLFYFDIDDFKKINDTYGHVIGDELLAEVCRQVIDILLDMGLKEQSSFARLAGDEFVLTITDCDEETGIELSKRIGLLLKEPISLSSCDVKVGISLGLAYSNDENVSFQELLSRADSAMYCAKQQGKGQYKLFDESVASAMYFKKVIAENLTAALKANEFALKFMPIYKCDTLRIERVEVLIRCEAENMDGITPDVFIPIAEDFGIIKNIDLWVLETTFACINEHFIRKNTHSPVFCINISAIELRNDAFPNQLKKLINKYSINPDLIELEITETSLIEADDTTISILNELKSLGVHLALDDFGTGYTAFNQLLTYPVDCLKIDRTFVGDIELGAPTKMTMVNAIISIAKSYELLTVGEGIESQEQLDYLKSVSCDYVQGFYLSKPLELAYFLDLLNKQGASDSH